MLKDRLCMVFISTIVLYLFVIVISPVESNFGFSWMALLMLLTSVILIPFGILLGVRFANLIPRKKAGYACGNQTHYNGKNLAFTVSRLNYCAGLGLLLMLVDRFFIRGMPVGLDLFGMREVMELTETTAFGLVGQILSGLVVFSTGYLIIERKKRAVSTIKVAITYSLALTYLLLSVMLGSRSGVLNLVLIVTFMVLLNNYINDPKYNLSFSVVFKVLFFGFALAVIMAAMFLWRVQEMGLDIAFSVLNSGFAYTVTPTDAVLSLAKDDIFGDLFLAMISLVQYVIHGFYEFQLLVENFNGNHTYGQQVLWFPIKVFNTLGGSINIADLEAFEGVRYGIFTTFFGPVFIDFGVYMPVASGLIFFILSIPIGFLNPARIWLVAYCALICTLVICLPVWNSILTAAWMYPFVAVFLIPLITLRFRKLIL